METLKSLKLARERKLNGCFALVEKHNNTNIKHFHVSTEAEDRGGYTLRDLQNSSYPTKAEFNNC